MNGYARTQLSSTKADAPLTIDDVSLRKRQDQFSDDLLALLPRLRRFARRLTGSRDQADDLLQACCERALSRQHQWQPGSRLDSWVFTIMRSIQVNDLKASTHLRARKSLELDAEIPDEKGSTPERDILHNEVFERVNALPKLQQTAIVLVYVEGYKYQEAADLLGIPLGTLMSRLARAKAQVGKWISEGGNAITGKAHPTD